MRSEAITVVLLQKLKSAKRVYATVVYTKANSDGYKEQSITFPSAEMQAKLFSEFYDECDISPSSLSYLEAHGTGTWVGDPEELNAMDKIFLKGRNTPLLIGSVKSNLGHAEPASGLCQLVKVLTRMDIMRGITISLNFLLSYIFSNFSYRKYIICYNMYKIIKQESSEKYLSLLFFIR